MLRKNLFPALLVLLAATAATAAKPTDNKTHKIPESLKAKFFGMRGYPEVKGDVDLAEFFPMIDQFGQYPPQGLAGQDALAGGTPATQRGGSG
jgi:hypothetical protein